MQNKTYKEHEYVSCIRKMHTNVPCTNQKQEEYLSLVAYNLIAYWMGIRENNNEIPVRA